MSENLIIPTGIPQFVGELGTLEKEAKSLASNAKLFRDSGAGVHTSFQGLSACYKAPEADKLFATTTPVATKSDGFADDLEKVSSALDAYASEVRPLAAKLATLKEQAIAFVASVENDDDWRKDKKKVDRNNELWHSVNATVDAFHAAERACHDKIVALVGGTSLIADDGSHKSNMYGYKASDLDRAEETPWGSMAEREYTGLAWLRHQAKSFLWDGIVMDGIVGTAKGVATLFGSEGWGKAGEAWTGLAKLATGVIITMTPLSGAYWMASDDQLPEWFRDSRTTMKQTGKAFVAYDQWGKNPSRAAGGVTFNVLTTVFAGGAGAAAKGGAAAKTFAAAGKVGRLIDPMTYVGKAGKYTFVQVGDLMSSLKTLNPGTSLRIAGETFRLADEAAAARRPAGVPEEAAPFVDHKGRPVYLNPKTGELFDEHGKVKQPAESVPKEGSAAERAAEAERAHAPQPDRALVGAGARASDNVTASATHTGDNVVGGASNHPPGGAASHQPGGSADDPGRRPSANHEPPTGPRDPSPSHDGDTSGRNTHGSDSAHHNGQPQSGESPDGAGSRGDGGMPSHGETHHESGRTPAEQPGATESKGAAAQRRGREYEEYLQGKMGGGDSFREGGREFDGSYPGGKVDARTWFEAKSGSYWDRVNRDPKTMLKFKSNLGDARRIATEHGKEFLLISEKEIPDNIVKWLEKKGYNWKIVPKE